MLAPSFGIFLPTAVQGDSVCFMATVVADGIQEGTEATGITITQQPSVFDTSAPLGFSASFMLIVTDDDGKSNTFCYCVYRAYIIVIYVCFFNLKLACGKFRISFKLQPQFIVCSRICTTGLKVVLQLKYVSKLIH